MKWLVGSCGSRGKPPPDFIRRTNTKNLREQGKWAMCTGNTGDLRKIAYEAWLYTLPLVELATARDRVFALGGQINVFTHVRNLANYRSRAVTTQNNDTLYSTAHVDLSQGPVTITLPTAGERYLSLALMDAYTNNFAIFGTRTTGLDGGIFTLVAPWDDTERPNVIRAPTPHVWALARILVHGPHDLPVARAVQQEISMHGPAVAPPSPTVSRDASWAIYFAAASALLAANPPPVTDHAILARIAALDLGAGFDANRFSTEEDARQINEGITEARRLPDGAHFIEGWSYPLSDLGNFGQNYAYRAAVARSGLGALPPVEAMYMRAAGEGRRSLYDGTKAWLLHFPAGHLPPVNSFWSLSLYEAMDDGRFFFTNNPLDRYAISDRTEGLKMNPNGSLDIWIGHENPGPGRESNWLPAPPGYFTLFMRTYLPKPELLEGRYRLPLVVRA